LLGRPELCCCGASQTPSCHGTDGETPDPAAFAVCVGARTSRSARHSDQLHVIEKFKRSAADNLQIEVTIDDPKAYTQLFAVSFNMRLQPKWDVAEMYCIDTLGFEAFEAGGAPRSSKGLVGAIF
jgi:hypothetical protein